jgi:hypothetical protein
VPSYTDREYVSRYGGHTTGLVIHQNGTPTDADGAVTVDMKTPDGTTTVFAGRAATRTDVGTYEVSLGTADTDVPGEYDLTWHFTLATVPSTVLTYVLVGESAPAYDALSPEMKGVAEAVWGRFADLFDSPMGGPHLQVYFQAHFGRQRIAQAMGWAVGRMNTIAQPYQSYTIDGTKPFPIQQWGPLLEHATYVETIKHLIRSYTEQPDWPGVTISRAERRDYADRWRSVLDMETQDLNSQLQVFKIANMGLGRPHVLVSGGVYGRYGPTRLVGSAASRPRFWARFYA